MMSTIDIWSPELVRDRLVEAYEIERRMPGPRFTAIATAWPATPLHSFQDVLHWTDARQRVWDSWAKAKGCYPSEVSRMEEAQEWLRWLPTGERNCLNAWAACSAFGIPATRVLRKQGWKKTTFYRKVNDGSLRIACRLNAQGVVVRAIT